MRKIGQTRRNVPGTVVLRNGTAVVQKSTLERNFVIRKDFFLHVVDVIPQPVEIPFIAENGRNERYTLACATARTAPRRRGPARELVEAKSAKEWRAHWRRWSAKWNAAWGYTKGQSRLRGRRAAQRARGNNGKTVAGKRRDGA